MKDRMRKVGIQSLTYMTNHVVAHMPSHNLRLAWYRALGISIGPNSAVHLGCRLLFFGPGQLRRDQSSIGSNSIVNRDCVLDFRGSLKIGDNVSISAETVILTAFHRWQEPGFRDDFQPVVIEDHAWIGTRATILPGARIGRGAVVSSGSVRGGDVPDMTVIAGVPGRAIGKRPEAALEYRLENLTPLFE